MQCQIVARVNDIYTYKFCINYSEDRAFIYFNSRSNNAIHYIYMRRNLKKNVIINECLNYRSEQSARIIEMAINV